MPRWLPQRRTRWGGGRGGKGGTTVLPAARGCDDTAGPAPAWLTAAGAWDRRARRRLQQPHSLLPVGWDRWACLSLAACRGLQVADYSSLIEFSEAERAEAAARLQLVQKLLGSCRVRSSEELLALVAGHSARLAQHEGMQGGWRGRGGEGGGRTGWAAEEGGGQ